MTQRPSCGATRGGPARVSRCSPEPGWSPCGSCSVGHRVRWQRPPGSAPQPLSQAERGDTTLSAANIARVASFLQISPAAFVEQPEPQVALIPQFRHLRRTPQASISAKPSNWYMPRRGSSRCFKKSVRIPKDVRLRVRGTCRSRPAHAEEAKKIRWNRPQPRARDVLGVSPDDPIGDDVIGHLEAGGITVVRDPDTDEAIDAYSAIVGGLPIIVLDGGSDSVWDRDNFNLAHELAHLVLHRGVERALRAHERSRHRLTASLEPSSAPRMSLGPELPSDLDWGRYLQLKRTWGMSMAALVRRAKDLKVIDDSDLHASDEAAQLVRLALQGTGIW